MEYLRSHIFNTFWFIPVVMGAAAIGLAQLMLAIDIQYDGQINLSLASLGADGGRGILVAIAGSVLGVAATSFAITMSVLATASSTYGPRLVQNFMTDRRNQVILGAFGATFLYCLTVLRDIRSGPDDGSVFVPTLAINVAIGLAIFMVLALVYFIHHIADSVQVATLVDRVSHNLVSAVNRLYPANEGKKSTNEIPKIIKSQTQRATKCGYVRSIDLKELVSDAEKNGAQIELLIEPGDYVIGDAPIAHVIGDRELTVQDYLTFSNVRTPYQDIRYALEQPVDMIIRALSPSMNDPYTAINAMHGLSAGLALLIDRDDREIGLCDDQDIVRVITKITDIDQMIRTVYRTLRNDVSTSIDATLGLIDITDALLYDHEDSQYRSLLVNEITQLGVCVTNSSLDEGSKQDAVTRVKRFVVTHTEDL